LKEFIQAPDNEARENITAYFTWGSKQAEYLVSNQYYFPEQVHITGAPRYDFYMSDYHNCTSEPSIFKDIKNKSMILIATNFSLANPAFKTAEEEIEMLISTYGLIKDDVLKQYEVDKNCLHSVAMLANRLADAFPQAEFVLRPHPFENINTYRELLEPRPNLHLIKSGSVEQWIMRSIAIIQQGSSTSVEAGLAGKPSFMLEWVPRRVHSTTVESVSIKCDSEEELKENINSVINGEFQLHPEINGAINDVVNNWFYKIDGKAHERIADLIIELTKNNYNQAAIKTNCRNNYYGCEYNRLSTKNMLIGKISSMYRQYKSLTNSNYQIDSLPWDESEKSYNDEQVRNIVESIITGLKNNIAGKEVRVEASQKHGDYNFGYQKGRSVTIYSK